jgi:hypothetical protein
MLRSQPKTSNRFPEMIYDNLRDGGLELPDRPRPGAAVHRRPEGAAARHRGQDGRHRAQRLRHRHRSHQAGYVVKHMDGRRNRRQIQAYLPLPGTDSRERAPPARSRPSWSAPTMKRSIIPVALTGATAPPAPAPGHARHGHHPAVRQWYGRSRGVGRQSSRPVPRTIVRSCRVQVSTRAHPRLKQEAGVHVVAGRACERGVWQRCQSVLGGKTA